MNKINANTWIVSTHSRPKAAGNNGKPTVTKNGASFNTQPPEGGWLGFVPVAV